MFILRQRSIVVVHFAIDDRPSNGWRGGVGEEKRFPGVNIGGEVRKVVVGMQQTIVFIFLEIVFCGTKCACTRGENEKVRVAAEVAKGRESCGKSVVCHVCACVRFRRLLFVQEAGTFVLSASFFADRGIASRLRRRNKTSYCTV